MILPLRAGGGHGPCLPINNIFLLITFHEFLYNFNFNFSHNILDILPGYNLFYLSFKNCGSTTKSGGGHGPGLSINNNFL